MKNIMQYTIIAALAAGCLFLLLERSRKSGNPDGMEHSHTDHQVETKAKEVSRQSDAKGLETVVFDINQNKASPNALSLNRKTKGIIDSAVLALDLRTKQLKQIMLLKSSIEAENLQLKRQLDSLNVPYYIYSANGIKLRFTPPNALDSVGRADFTADIEIKATQFWRRSWLFGPKKDYIAIRANQPMFRLNNLDYLEIEHKQPKIQLKVQASSAYDLGSGMFRYGPAAVLDLGRLSLKGYYAHAPGFGKWATELSASFDLLHF